MGLAPDVRHPRVVWLTALMFVARPQEVMSAPLRHHFFPQYGSLAKLALQSLWTGARFVESPVGSLCMVMGYVVSNAFTVVHLVVGLRTVSCFVVLRMWVLLG